MRINSSRRIYWRITDKCASSLLHPSNHDGRFCYQSSLNKHNLLPINFHAFHLQMSAKQEATFIAISWVCVVYMCDTFYRRSKHQMSITSVDFGSKHSPPEAHQIKSSITARRMHLWGARRKIREKGKSKGDMRVGGRGKERLILMRWRHLWVY